MFSIQKKNSIDSSNSERNKIKQHFTPIPQACSNCSLFYVVDDCLGETSNYYYCFSSKRYEFNSLLLFLLFTYSTPLPPLSRSLFIPFFCPRLSIIFALPLFPLTFPLPLSHQHRILVILLHLMLKYTNAYTVEHKTCVLVGNLHLNIKYKPYKLNIQIKSSSRCKCCMCDIILKLNVQVFRFQLEAHGKFYSKRIMSSQSNLIYCRWCIYLNLFHNCSVYSSLEAT